MVILEVFDPSPYVSGRHGVFSELGDDGQGAQLTNDCGSIPK
jgi:hypothetical protein